MMNNNHLIWIDLEMTGLNPNTDRIIEMAVIVTDSDLTILAEGPVLAVHQSDECLAGMDAWNTRVHNGSGLVERVKNSTITEEQAQKQMIDFLSKWIQKGYSPMCGNSICQDRRFLYNYMPELEAYFHYRNLDVSSIKELVKRWKPALLSGVVKESKHQALDDIKESINELLYYKKHFIRLEN